MKLTKSLLAAAVAASGLTAGVAQAQEDAWSMNVGVTSNYIWRGVSQSADAASVSGGIDYAHESGFYAGTWIGSLGDNSGAFSGAETDFYFGFGGEAGSVAYDVGYAYYHYADDQIDRDGDGELDDNADTDFGEVYGSISIGGFSAGINYTVNNDDDNDDFGFESGDIHYSVGYGFDISENWSASATYGFYDFESDGVENALSSYGYFLFDVSKGDFTYSISKADDESGDDDLKFIISWGTSF